jgi:hypothetical protein
MNPPAIPETYISAVSPDIPASAIPRISTILHIDASQREGKALCRPPVMSEDVCIPGVAEGHGGAAGETRQVADPGRATSEEDRFDLGRGHRGRTNQEPCTAHSEDGQ